MTANKSRTVTAHGIFNSTYISIAKQAELAVNTVSIACKGQKNVFFVTAEKIASALEQKTDALFEIYNSEKKLSQRTVAAHAALIGLILDNVEKELLVKYNAHSKTRAPKRGVKEADFFSTDEILQILDYSKKESLKWQLILHLLVITGGRRGEIAGLKWENVDFEEKQIR